MEPNYVQRNVEMDCIAVAFAGYIHRHPSLDLLWSEKVGYVLLTVNHQKQRAEEEHSFRTAEVLAYRMFGEIATDVALETGREHWHTELDEEETEEVWMRWAPFLEILPEYRYVCEDILAGNDAYEE